MVAAAAGTDGMEVDFGKFEDMMKDLKAPDVMYEGWRDSVYGRERQREGVDTYRKSDDKVASDRVTVYTTQAEPGDMYYSEYYREPAILTPPRKSARACPETTERSLLTPCGEKAAMQSRVNSRRPGERSITMVSGIIPQFPQERGHSPEPIERFPGYSPARTDVRRLRAPPTTLLLSSVVTGRSLLTVIRRRSSWKASIPIRIT